MSKKVFSFGVGLPEVEGLVDLSLLSGQSWLDADVIVIRPTFEEFEEEDYYRGRPSLNEGDSFRIQSALASWMNKVTTALNAGKTIIFILPPHTCVNVDTGKRTYSGTGRNREVTTHVKELSNYEFISLGSERHKPVFESGSAIARSRDIGPLAPLYARYEGRWRYNCHFTPETLRPALTTAAGGFCVGAYSRTGVVFLPDIDWSQENLWTEDADGDLIPTPKGTQAAHGFRDEIVALHKVLHEGAERTPVPSWSATERFVLPEERPLQDSLADVRTSLLELEEKRATLESQLEEAGELRNLLFETGKPLERSVRSALELLGFSVSILDDGKSEFDAVFESAEGRFIGEVEGREKLINVAKISQLRRNVDEDFARDEIDQPATGVLFGNGCRLEDPAKRTECFTSKVVSAAPALSIVLVNTVDLFEAAKSIALTGDGELAKQCRRAIADSVGELVRFPKLSDLHDAPMRNINMEGATDAPEGKTGAAAN